MQVDLNDFDLFNPTDEHKMLRQSVRAFVAKEIEPGAHQRDREEYFDQKLLRKLGDLGLLGITAPAAYGGSEMDALAAVIVHEELSYSDPGLCLAFLAHALLCVNNIAVNASEAQKHKFLPKLCSGEWIGCMAMSEPQTGTDVLGMTTSAVKTDDVYWVNGRKMWITNGAVDDHNTPADVVFLYAKTALLTAHRPSITSLLVTKDMPGFSVGQKIGDKLGMRASLTAELVFEDCQVPLDNRVGQEGESIQHMMRNLEIERVGLAAMGLGIARRAMDIMTQYARDRHSFGKPLYRHGQIQKYLADSYADLSAARAYVYDVARKLKLSDHKQGRKDSDGVKLIAAAMSKRVSDAAIQVLGGYGYVGEYVVERLWRDAKLLEIGGGTLEAHQKNIANDLCKI